VPILASTSRVGQCGGKIPFTGTFAKFLPTGRVYDQITSDHNRLYLGKNVERSDASSRTAERLKRRWGYSSDRIADWHA